MIYRKAIAEPEEELLTIKEAAKLLKISEISAKRYRTKGVIASVKIGGARRIIKNDVWGNYQLEKFVLVLSMFLLFTLHGFSQSKYEREFRIGVKEVPSIALSFVDSIPLGSRVKWYKEIGLDKITIEAKAKFRKERYSIEFCENGIFQDAEIEVKPNKIPSDTFLKITEILTQRHKRYKSERVQIQYTGDRNTVLGFLRENRNNPEGITTNYEFVISTKMDGKYVMLEYLFSETGEYVQSTQIISRRKDTIDY